MSLLTKLKTVLGLDASPTDRETRVAVEHERADFDGYGETSGRPESVDRDKDDPVDRVGAATPSSDAPDTPSASPSPEGNPLDSIKGIGPAYAERLEAAGIETVDELAGADAERLAVETDISEKRLQGWIDRAAAAT